MDLEGLPAPRVALMQPTFPPWQGFFALAAFADVFVLLDDFQFQRHSFHQRNRLRLPDGSETWVTVPVAHSGGDEFPRLDEAAPMIDDKWRRRLKTTLDQSYGKAEHHHALRPDIDRWIDAAWPSLAEMNVAFVRFVAQLLGFTPQWQRSSQLHVTGSRSARVLELLRATEAGTYLCARGSFDYMVEDALFPVDGIDVVFQEFEPQPYPQRRADEFVSHLSVLDALFEVGPDATRDLVLAGQRAWVPWRDMLAMTDATRDAP